MRKPDKHKLINWLRIVLYVIMFICVFQITTSLYKSYNNKKQQQQLQSLISTTDNTEDLISSKAEITLEDSNKDTSNEDEAVDKSTKPESQSIDKTLVSNKAEDDTVAANIQPPQLLPEYLKLYEQNNDLIGWLTVEGTVINYPVMKGNDDEYYLDHDFEGNKNSYGCLFVKTIADVDTPGTNVVIYGHNRKDGTMFGQLKKYKEESFYTEHPYIEFHSLYEKRNYEIISVFFSQVYKKEDDVFKYYQFYQADTKEDFMDFYENIKKLSLYDTEVDAEYGDRFITLSTCEYHVENGRFVIVAKEIISDE